MVRQSTEPGAATHLESPRSATQEGVPTNARAPTTSKWPRVRKSRLSILPEVDDEGNEVEDDSDTDIFTRDKFYARFTVNTDSLYATVLSVIEERDSLIKELNELHVETETQIKALVDENYDLKRTILRYSRQDSTSGNSNNNHSSKSIKLPDPDQLDDSQNPSFKS